MTVTTIVLAAFMLLVLAIIVAGILGWASQAFKVEVDPRIDQILSVLPGANCGGCGFGGCGVYADAVVTKNAAVTMCPVGGESCAQKIADIMGVKMGEALPFRPVVHCAAHSGDKHRVAAYTGEQSCAAINLISAAQGCVYGCLGHGDCERACKYDAISVVDGLATVNYDRCIGCRKCAEVCPRGIISMTPFKKSYVISVRCSNRESGKDVRDVCDVGCLGCSICTKVSHDVFQIQNNVATVNQDAVAENIIGIKTAMEKCPRHSIVLVGKPSSKDLEMTKDIVDALIAMPEFKTTVDEMKWRG